ncbi:MAG: hypothetical protein AUK03_12635 [Anaerolineae bacterium CG2_30_64_16]|nr:MAG: hypothetical protein AUK03_12635 [Anaerolineae bacterium CG2_30_64_16]
MISLETARKLRDAGLAWQPAQGDRFAIPDRGLDDHTFVINDMAAIIEVLGGAPAVTFHGTPEWALDYLYLGETIWLPDEGQLRTLLQDALAAHGATVYDLLYIDGTYTCRFEFDEQALAFHAPSASEAYAEALLHVFAQGITLMGIKGR